MNTTLTSGQLALQLKVLDEKKMTPERWNRILASGILADLCDKDACLDRNAVRRALKLEPLGFEQSTLVVIYDLSFREMVAAGHYEGGVHDDLTSERFPIAGEGVETVEVRNFHFNRSCASEDALRWIKADGWKPAKIEHLLAYGYKYPEEQRKYPIVALGSSTTLAGYRVVPYLHRDGGTRERCVMLHPQELKDYEANSRFLAVRTPSPVA